MAAGQSRHEHATATHGVRRRRDRAGRRRRPRAGRRRLPDAVAGRDARPPSACSSPGRTGSRAPPSRPRPCSPTPSGARRTEVRGSSSRSRARCSSTSRPAGIGIDPIELRRRNLLRRDELPYASATGFVYDHVTPLETFEQAIAMLDYDAFRREQARGAHRRPVPRGRHVHLRRADDSRLRRLRHGGRDHPDRALRARSTCTSPVVPTGNSLETTVVQLMADALGVDIDDVATIQGDTAVTPFGAGACGSRSASMTAGAVAETAAVLRDRILAIAAHRLEVAAEDLELAGGRVSVRGTPSKAITYAEIARDRVPLSPASSRPGRPRASRRAPGTPRRRRRSGRTRRTSARARSTSRPGTCSCCATS